MTLKKVKPRPPLQRSGQTFQTFQRTNFLPVQPVHTEPCKFCCRLPCMAGVRRGSEGGFGSDRNTRGAKEGGREGGGGGRETSSLLPRARSLAQIPFRLPVKKTCTVLLGSRVNERPFYASFCPFKNLSGTVKAGSKN